MQSSPRCVREPLKRCELSVVHAAMVAAHSLLLHMTAHRARPPPQVKLLQQTAEGAGSWPADNAELPSTFCGSIHELVRACSAVCRAAELPGSCYEDDDELSLDSDDVEAGERGYELERSKTAAMVLLVLEEQAYAVVLSNAVSTHCTLTSCADTDNSLQTRKSHLQMTPRAAAPAAVAPAAVQQRRLAAAAATRSSKMSSCGWGARCATSRSPATLAPGSLCSCGMTVCFQSWATRSRCVALGALGADLSGCSMRLPIYACCVSRT